MCKVMCYEGVLNNEKLSSTLLGVNLRDRTCANNYFYLSFFAVGMLQSTTGILCEIFVSVLNLENHGKTNIFHFSNDMSYTRLMIVQRSEHEISSLNKEAALFCSSEAAVGTDFSLFRHSMCSRQILRLHKLMSQLLIIFPHHFFSPIVFFVK